MMTVNPVVYFGTVALSAFLTGLSKGGLGGTLGALITPLMALVMPVDQAIGLLLPIFILGDIFALVAHWQRWNQRLIWLLLPGALVGITLGTFVLTNVPVAVLQRLLGFFIFSFILYRLVESKILKALRYRAHNWHGLVAGSLAGFTSTLAHAGGPVIVIYLLMQNISPTILVATSVLFFAVLNWIKVPYYYQAGLFDFPALIQLLWLAPLVPLGVWVGRRLTERVDRLLFERIILLLLGLSGVLLLTR